MKKLQLLLTLQIMDFYIPSSIGIIHSSKEYFINLDADYQLYDFDYFLIFKS